MDSPAARCTTPINKRRKRSELTVTAEEAKKNFKNKTFQSRWLEYPSYKNWLAPHVTNKQLCICSVCNKTIACGKSELDKHAQGQKHQKNLRAINKTVSVYDLFKQNTITQQQTNHINQVKSAEIKLAAFYAEHNVAVSVIDHLTPLLQSIFPDSKILSDVKLKRTKCSEMIKNVLAKHEVDSLIKHLQTNKFSILVDESTDISVTKTMCVLVRYLLNDVVQTSLLELLSIDAKDGSAEALYATFKQCLNEKGIPVQNIVGVASDGAAVMVGKTNSFFSRIKNEVPDVILMKCICHSSAIIAAKACEQLPRTPEDLMRTITSYLSASAKRSAVLQEFQDFFQLEQRKILKLATTRWLSMHACVVRILENWEALLHYFLLAVVEDKLKSSEFVVAELKNNFTKGYFCFLKYALNVFNQFNTLFQSNKPLVHKLYENSHKLMRFICQNFLKPEIIMENNLGTINLKHPSYFINVENIYVGADCESLLRGIPKLDQIEFKKICLNFYVTAAVEIQSRLPLNNNLFKEMLFLNPEIALLPSGREKLQDLTELGNFFSNDINKDALNLEWRNLAIAFDTNEAEALIKKPVEEVWQIIGKCKNFDEQCMFPNLGKLANFTLILPHSNAEAERIFSVVTDVKTKKRNRLGEDLLNSIAVVRSSMRNKSTNCFEFNVTDNHLKLHNKEMYSFK